MRINIAVLDDSEQDRDRLEGLVRKYLQDRGCFCEIKAYSRSELLMMDLQEQIRYDLFLLDMEMPDCTGLEAARRIRRYCPEAFVIYVTNYLDFALEGYEVGAFRYIFKGDLPEKLSAALDAVIDRLGKLDQRTYVAEHNGLICRILYRDIFYIRKAEERYALIYHQGASCIIQI